MFFDRFPRSCRAIGRECNADITWTVSIKGLSIRLSSSARFWEFISCRRTLTVF